MSDVRRSRKWNRVRTEVLKRDGYRCHWCGTDLHQKDAYPEVDHVQPMARGGAPLDKGNLVASCRTCNRSRGVRGAMRPFFNRRNNDTPTVAKFYMRTPSNLLIAGDYSRGAPSGRRSR